MAKKLPLSIGQWMGLAVLAAGLVGVRLFENTLFYDPFLAAFKKVRVAVPPYDTVKLFLNYFLRYIVNSALSVGILWLCFKDRSIIKLTTVLYGVLFAVLAIALYIVLQMDAPSLKAIFYLRRFIIQPLPLLLFLPAFYYQRYVGENPQED